MAELGLMVAAPGPKLPLRSDDKGVVVAGANSHNIGGKARDAYGFVCVGSKASKRCG